MALIAPGSPRWRDMRDPRDRFKILTECILEEQRKTLPDFEKLEQLWESREAYRAACVATLPLVQSRLWDSTHNISVVTDKLGKARRYSRKAIQRRIATFIDERRHRQIWAAIWKYRQGGVSTEIASEIHLGTTREHGVKSLVVAQADPEAATIFEEKYVFMHRHDPLAPVAGRANTGELYFPALDSRIEVRSAGGRRGVGRGGNRRYCHLSEAAWYPGNPYVLIGGILQGITHPQAMVFMESTANGQAGMFYETCLEALNAATARREGREPEVETKWEPIFLPWFDEDEARNGVPFASVEARERFVASMRDDEKLIADEFELTPEQMHWYRDIFDSKIKGETMDSRLMLIQQEYPSRPLDAFVAPGSSAFDMPTLVNYSLKVKPPIWQGDIQVPGSRPGVKPLYDHSAGEVVSSTPTPHLAKREGAPLRIWKRPVPGRRYVWAWDLAASGSAKSDSTEGYCLDRDTEECVAHYMVKQNPNDTVVPCRLLSKYYNDALICPENNFQPGFIHSLLETDRKPFMFWRMASGEAGITEEMSREYGHRTTMATKRDLVYLMREKLGTTPQAFIDKHLLDQLKTFKQVQTPQGDWRFPGAVPGSGTHDDGAMAMMIALKANRDAPLRGVAPDAMKDGAAVVSIRDMMKGHRQFEQERALDDDMSGL